MTTEATRNRVTLVLVLILVLANLACRAPATASPKIHVVQRGDTPESVAAQYGVTLLP